MLKVHIDPLHPFPRYKQKVNNPFFLDAPGALARARINFFNDTFANKVITPLFSGLMGPDELRLAKANQLVEGIEKHIVPLLEDAGPFFGGSKQLTHAEVL